MIKINMMCGKRNFGKEWLHVDEANFSHIDSKDIQCNNHEPHSVDVIYCSHGIAYFDKVQLRELLTAWKLVLKEDGILRLATPDFDALSKLYQSKIELPRLTGPLYGRMEMNETVIFHKTVWDFNTLSNLLYEIGFKNVWYYDHKKTDHAQYDDHSAAYIDGHLISLNVECYA